ncbi:MAG: response regulator transcription factor [Hyphomicrobiales bacterium]|nr:response regulator transcription factor [Hyphomicrobiales bacterium]MCY4048044.1 response regulator transcription factor [Hyphomicrobiales bacterium]MCY4052308.1 response regulator transcription factor [Hyphomicrobiales bacterium]
MAKKIMLVDDNKELRETLCEQFEPFEEFDVIAFEDAKGGLQHTKENRIDLALLDVILPDMDGRELCKNLRKNGMRAPIIMLTSADSESDTIRGLDSGADDYVTKPFRFNVLLARIRANFRKHEQSEDAQLTIGNYIFRPGTKILTREGDEKFKIRLTEKETAILKYLYRADGKVISKEELLAEVWGYNKGVTTHTLETHIYRLRQKIEAEPQEEGILLTETGGYRLAL